MHDSCNLLIGEGGMGTGTEDKTIEALKKLYKDGYVNAELDAVLDHFTMFNDKQAENLVLRDILGLSLECYASSEMDKLLEKL